MKIKRLSGAPRRLIILWYRLISGVFKSPSLPLYLSLIGLFATGWIMKPGGVVNQIFAPPKVRLSQSNGKLIVSAKLPLSTCRHASPVPGKLRQLKVDCRQHGLSSDVVIEVDDDLTQATNYHIDLAGLISMRSITGRYNLQVKTPTRPSIRKLSGPSGSEIVSDNGDFRVFLTEPDIFNLVNLSINMTPAIKTKVVTDSKDARLLHIIPLEPLPQGGQYEIVVGLQEADGSVTNSHKLLFKTAAEPIVTGLTPDSLATANGVIVMHFISAMDRKSVLVTAQDLALRPIWLDDKNLELTYSGAVPGHTYDLQLISGSRTQEGGVLRNTKSAGQISTNGAIVASSPQEGRVIEPDTPIQLNFNQLVDHVSAEKAFSIKPAVEGNFKWIDETLVFNPKGMTYQTQYQVKLNTSVVPIFGKAMAAAQTISIATVTPVHRLGLPYLKQTYRLSCEEASLRMILAKKGITASDMEIVQRVGYGPTARDTVSNSWDDPAQMFVGDINGQIGVTGWGVYAGPIARVAQSYGLGAKAYYNVDAQFIAQQIYANKAVIIWGAPDSSRPDSWNTPGGVRQVPKNDHTMVVEGVVGLADQPISFYVNDPLKTTVSYSTSQLNNFLSAYNNAINMVVVVDL